MEQRHKEKIEKHSDNMRFILEHVLNMLDDRLSDQTREKAAYQLMDRTAFYPVIAELLEIFRTIANERTDNNHG